MNAAPVDRFFAKVDKDGSAPEHRPDLGPCWLWMGCRQDGYGKFRFGGRSRGAHRVSYELCVGPIPEGLQLDHLCRVTHCVNPAHLEPVTARENTMRSDSVTAINARKTHCDHGHEFTPENTYRDRTGRRNCRICISRRGRAYYARKQAA